MYKMIEWTDQQILYYYLGMEYSDYPQVFWEMMAPAMLGCTSLLDIGCGPGAFSLIAAAGGFHVQAVDINRKHLEALRRRKETQGLHNIDIIGGDWLKVSVERSDVAVCAYSFGGTIGAAEGIKKVIDQTRKVAFFISPCQAVKTDFMSETLYEKLGLTPPAYSSGYRDLLQLFGDLRLEVKCEIVAYDFGMPLAGRAEIDDCAAYLADKLSFPSIPLVREHLQNIITERNGQCWVPNPRKSAIITWQR